MSVETAISSFPVFMRGPRKTQAFGVLRIADYQREVLAVRRVSHQDACTSPSRSDGIVLHFVIVPWSFIYVHAPNRGQNLLHSAL